MLSTYAPSNSDTLQGHHPEQCLPGERKKRAVFNAAQHATCIRQVSTGSPHESLLLVTVTMMHMHHIMKEGLLGGAMSPIIGQKFNASAISAISKQHAHKLANFSRLIKSQLLHGVNVKCKKMYTGQQHSSSLLPTL